MQGIEHLSQLVFVFQQTVMYSMWANMIKFFLLGQFLLPLKVFDTSPFARKCEKAMVFQSSVTLTQLSEAKIV